MSERQSLWNGVALVATLGLAAVVAVVAVTRSEEEPPSAEPTPTASASPSVSPSPGGLGGEGPYVVYATGAGVFAYDVGSGKSTELGPLDGDPVTERSRQPGSGRIVAFPTSDGSVWTVTRAGMRRVGAIPPAQGDEFQGAVVSRDDRRLAVASIAPKLATVIVDLRTGRATSIPRERRGQYPTEPLVPVAWSLGGTVIYQMPFCRCVEGTTGLYTLDTTTRASTLLGGTRGTVFNRFVVSGSAQSLFYGTSTARRCRTNETAPCEGPPFTLRRFAAGRRGSEILERASDASFIPSAISLDGHLILVVRVDPERSTSRIELYSEEGELDPGLPRGIPRTAQPLALLPRDVVVAATTDDGEIVVVRAGSAETVAKAGSEGAAAPTYLGWLQ